MALPSCRRCGATDPHRMIGLMTLWFGPFIDLEPAHGYFHLCPACFEECVAPHLDELQSTLARLNPAAAAYLEREQARDLGRVDADRDADADADEDADEDADGDADGDAAS